MTTVYPSQIDTSITLPTAIDNNTPVEAVVVNRLRDAILAIETELGVKPSSVYTTVRNRLDNLELLVASGGVVVAGDLGGTPLSPLVIGIQGNPVINTTLGAGQDGYVLTWINNDGKWEPRAPSSILATGGTLQFANAASDIGGYDQLVQSVNGVEADLPVTITNVSGQTLIKAFATALGTPDVTVIPAGLWEFDFYRYVSTTGGGNSNLIFQVYKRTSPGGVETLILTATGMPINDTSVAYETVIVNLASSVSVNASDRLVFKVYAQTTSAVARTVHFVFDGVTHVSHVRTSIVGGAISITGDVTGTLSNSTVVALQHVPVSSTAPTTNQVLEYNGSAWTPTTISLTLSGDVTGNISSNTVIAIHGATVPAAGSLTTGNVLQVTGSSALSYGAVNLAGGSTYVTGLLPTANQVAQSLTLTGDVTSSGGTTTSASTTVASISGASPINITPAVLQWVKGTSSPTITQATPTSDVATTAITIQPQAPFASASTNTKAGDVIINIPAAAGSGITEGALIVSHNGTPVVAIEQLPQVPGYGAIYLGSSASATNRQDFHLASIYGDTSGNTILNGAAVEFWTGFGLRGSFGPSGLGMASEEIVWNATIANPIISQGGQASDIATNPFVLQAQPAYTFATVNQVGGALLLRSGDGYDGYAAYDGYVHIQTGVTDRIVVTPTNVSVQSLAGNGTGIVGVDNNGVLLFASSAPPSGTAGGDLSGTYPNPTVVALQGNSVKSGALGVSQDGYVLTWNNADAKWEAEPISSGSVTLGGDVTGPATSNSVSAISGASPIFITPATLEWTKGTVSPTLTQATPTSDVAVTNLTIQSQAPFASASVNTSPGNIILNIPSPIGGANEGLVQIQRGGSNSVQFGRTSAVNYGYMWMGPISASTTNYTLSADGSTFVQLNATSGGTLYFSVNNVLSFQANTSNVTLTAPTLEWVTGASAPTITQVSTSVGSATNLTIQAQGATGASHNGGALNLSSGTSGSAIVGNVVLQTGGTTRLTVSPSNITVAAFSVAGVVHNDSSGNLSSSLIVDADVNSSAAIAVSKLAAGTAGQVLLNNSTPTPTWTTVSGDATISNTGIVTVTGLQTNPVQSGVLGASQDGYVLTWTNGSTQWQARPTSSTIVDGQDYQFSNTSSDVSSYDQLLDNATGSEGDLSAAVTSAGGKTLIKSFATAVNDPQVDLIPAGLWEFNFYAYASVLGAFTTQLIFDVYTRTSGGSETLLFSATSANLNVTSVGFFTLLFNYASDTYIADTTRIVIKVSAQTTSVLSVTAHFVFDGTTHASLVRTPLAGAAIQLGGDLSGTTSAATVVAISGSTPISIKPATLQWAAGTSSPTINQVTAASDVATTNLTISAQSAFAAASTNKTGGNLILSPGTGCTTNGNPGNVVVNLPAPTGVGLHGLFKVTDGGSTGVFACGISDLSSPQLYMGAAAISPTDSNYVLTSDGSTYTALNGPSGGSAYFAINGVVQVASSTVSTRLVPQYLVFDVATTGPTVTQNTVASGTGQTFTVQAQSTSSGTGGILVLASGTGTTNPGDLQLQIGATTLIDFSGSTIGNITISNSTATPNITQTAQASTSGGSGAAGNNFSITTQAGQAATGTSHNGGAGSALNLTAGVGGSSGSATGGAGGNVVITPGAGGTGSTAGAAGTIQFSGSQNVTVSSLKTSTYTIKKGDYFIGIGTLSGAIVVNLPASPSTGDVYVIKDVNGTVSGTNTVTVTPASGNIDGQSTFVMDTAYTAINVAYTGAQWSVY